MTNGIRMRGWIAVAPVVLGLFGGAANRLADSAPPRAGHAEQWSLGPVDEKVLRETADIDAILALDPPADFASTERWVEFGRTVKGIDTGAAYGPSGITSPLLGWFAYVAKQRPEALYRLYDEGVVSPDQLAHLIEMGLAPGWHEHVSDAERLILSNSTALASLAIEKGEAHARRRFADAFFSRNGAGIRLDLECLRFSLATMTDAEIEQVVPRLESGGFGIDPRDLRRLLLDGRMRGRERELLALIEAHAYRERSMSSYLVDGAMLGNTSYVRDLASDVADNALQPTNFYCSACGLALTADGLLGSALADAVANEGQLNLVQDDGFIAISAGAGVR